MLAIKDASGCWLGGILLGRTRGIKLSVCLCSIVRT